jgi:orotate phosphoribosyltransferase
VLDAEDLHHEFVSGMHGRKLDFDKIETGSEFYLQWVDVCVNFIRENYNPLPDIILGVANGANRLAVSIAAGLGEGTLGLMTEKESPKSSRFYPSVEDVIRGYKPKHVLVVEDVGTAGTPSATAALKALEAGAQTVSVLNTWQRRERLEKLEEAGVEYRSIIVEMMPTYEPDQCEYCKTGVKLVEHA